MMASSVGRIQSRRQTPGDTTDKMAKVFEVASGKEIARLPHGDAVWMAAFSSDGKLLATASWDKTARLFEVDGGKEIAVLPHDNQVMSVTFSPDGKLLLTASEDTTARLFNVAGSAEDVRLPHDGIVRSAVFSPDGKVLATASDDKTARLFDLASGKEIAKLPHDGEVISAAFSANGKLLATASYDNAVHLFEMAISKEIVQLAHGGSVTDVAFSPDGKLLATACGDKIARYSMSRARQEIASFSHEDGVKGVAFSPDGKLLATAASGKNDNDGEVRLYEVANNKKSSGCRTISRSAASPSARMANCSHHHRPGEPVRGSEWQGNHHHGCRRCDAPRRLQPRRQVACDVGGLAKRSAHLFELASGKAIVQIMDRWPVNSATFSPDGLTLATASDDRAARLWRLFPTTQALVDAAKAAPRDA